ncbi:polyprenol monophosphomannose synthase [Psychroflexus halocasei]|uniref:Dolichol-phosphate mannosyltransferase n=1 Tax=Psychroflexus halocasei TaxID=908615 RepID=A0A1H4CZF3_9FLAO|nr:polyprenol monophosphomannose synthase [Psychroflexus halocasei]SEA65720.1 dolichol-phosphate mannosyltransferase [Psychroflexus halocasei]
MNKRLVIIPTYNECENITDIIDAVFSLPLDFHLLVIDDNSPDGTPQLVKDLQKTYPNLFLEVRLKKNGLGTAYIHGFKWALEKGYEKIFQMDADFSHNPKDLVEMDKAFLTDGADVVIGSRYLTGVNVVNWPMKRVLMSWGASKYVKLITGLEIEDTTAGFVAYRKEVLEKIDLNRIKFIGYAFQIEMKYKAYHLGFNVKEIPIIFTDRTRGKSKMSSKIITEAVFGVIRMRFRKMIGKL